MIKNLVFDFGGVILSEDDNWVNSREVKDLFKIEDEQLDMGWIAAWPDARDGKTNEDQFFHTFLKNSVGDHTELQVISLKEIYRQMIEKSETFSLLPKLKDKYKIFALTNITKDWLNLKTKEFNLNDYFDLIISSCNEGIGKPNKEIYESLILKGNVIPEETIFIDNLERNIFPAKEFGFKTILFENRDKLIVEMKNLGIEI